MATPPPNQPKQPHQAGPAAQPSDQAHQIDSFVQSAQASPTAPQASPSSAPSPSQAKVFSLDDETPLGYFSKLTEFVYDPQYARYLRRIAERYQRELLPAELELMPFFVDALIFETFIEGQTVLDRFLQTYQGQLQNYQRRVYQNFKHYLFSAYRIVAHRGSDAVLLEDLLDGSAVLLKDSEARRQLFPGLYLMARLLPFEDYHIPTGACALLNYKDADQALEIARLLKLPPLMV